MFQKLKSFFDRSKSYEEYLKECESKGIAAKSKEEYKQNPEKKCL